MTRDESPDDDRTRTFVSLVNDTIIGHYRIVEKIGAGGMGEVYLAEDTELNRKVALKFLPFHLCQSEDCRARFKREAQAAAKLDHPNIVAVHEVSEFQGRPFFSMQHIEGQSLKEVLSGKSLSLDRILEIGIQVCEGLQAAHENGITHRDIKPTNILIDSHGRARIVDFGLASVIGSDNLTKTGSTMGTIGYMSPEQVRGDKIDQRSDLFSFGVVLYEMITGHAPFKVDSEAATLHAIMNTKPELLARFRREVFPELQTIIDKVLEKDVATRYQHADELAADLKRLSSTGVMQQKSHPDLWNRYVVTSAVAVLLIIVGYWAVKKYSPSDSRQVESARKMLAVLPFENLSPDPDQEYFSDGLTEELTSKLSQIQSLCVISRSSSMTFKGSNKTVPEIAKALKVQYIIEGSVRRAGNELRITAQLIDATADAHLWSKTYAGTLDDVFDMQDSVSRAIVDGIQVQLTPNETSRLGNRSFNNTAAFTYHLKGKAEMDKGTEDAINQGMQYFQQGLNIVGDNALIYIGMAMAYWSMVNMGLAQEEGISKAVEYSQKALNLDPELPEAYAMLGSINFAFFGNQRMAVDYFKRALVIDANTTIALGGLALVYYAYVGKVNASLPLIERRNMIFPLDSTYRNVKQGEIEFYAGEFQHALGAYRKAHETGLRSFAQTLSYALLLTYCDSVKEALSVIDEYVKANPTSSVINLLQVMRHALQEDKLGTLERLTPDVQQTCRRDAQYSYHLGALLTRAGAKKEAFDWLENAVNRGFINYPFMQKDPFLDSIRGEEQFKKLMERVKHEWEHFEI